MDWPQRGPCSFYEAGKERWGPSQISRGRLETPVSRHMGDMPFLSFKVGDEPSPASLRGLIERNLITLLSGYGERAPDPASSGCLGRFSDWERVRRSSPRNNNHVDDGLRLVVHRELARRVVGRNGVAWALGSTKGSTSKPKR